MRVKFGILVIAVFFAALFALGCNQGTQQAENSAKEEKMADSKNPAEITDAEITASVKSKFTTDENVAARRIDVETVNGIVTLRGVVATQTEIERAVDLAESADGVRVVHSYLKTDTDSDTKTSELSDKAQEAINEAGDTVETGVDEVQALGSDAAITAQIKWKLAKDKLVQAADIDVDTKDRRVTLTGIVSSTQEAQRALQIAQSVEDVLAVDSNIKIR